MEEKPNYYAVIPADVRYDERLRANEKLLYGEITTLTYKTGECWASNNYFAKLYKTTPQAISKWILDLQEYGYLSIEYEKKGNEILKRIIKLKVSINIDRVSTNVVEGYQQKFKENNTSINNTSIKKEIYKERKFKKPTLEEVKQYCQERGNNIDPEMFINFYESKDWYVGKNKMKNWKACVITWEQRDKTKPKKKNEFMETMKEIYDGTITIK